MIEMARPEHVLPTHGEYRHLALYTDLARETGILDDHIHKVAPGDVVTLSADTIEVTGRIVTGRVFVEGRRMDTVNEELLRHRGQIANEGLILVVLPVDFAARDVAGEANISAVGCAIQLDSKVFDEMKLAIRDTVDAMLERGETDRHRLEKRMRNIAASYVFRGHRRRPNIQTMIVEIKSGS